MYGADEFGPDFQRVLIRATLDDPHLRGIVQRFVREGRLGFTDPASQWSWRVMSSTDHPTMLQLQTEGRRVDPTDPAWTGIQAILASSDVRDHTYVAEQVVEWSRRQVFRLGFEEAREAWNSGNFDRARDVMLTRINEMSDIKLDIADRGWFFEELDERQSRRMTLTGTMDDFPTGIARLDHAMGGGLSFGELGVAIAYSKVGKTFWLTQQGAIGARMRRRVLHFALEGGRKLVENRYDAIFTGDLYTDVKRGEISADAMYAARREYEILKRNLIVRGVSDLTEWSADSNFILNEILHLRDSAGWVPELVIVDYADLLSDPGSDERAKQKESFRRMKSLSNRVGRGHPYGFAVWTASQAQRPQKGADEKEHVVKPRDVADSYEKVRVADALISLNRTTWEKKNNRARVFLGAYRDAEDGALIRVTTDYAHGWFCKVNEAEPPPLPPEAKAKAAA